MLHYMPALAFLAAFAGLSQAAPAAKPAATPTPTTTATAPSARKAPAPASTAQNDAALEKDIRARLEKSKISTNKFTVRVQGGVATLEGKTGVLQHKGTATRLARNAGALKVVNKIEVSEEAKQKSAANLEAGRRRAQVKRSEASARSEARR
ncbi:MAG: BON domain-containing protein [Bryobacterales bacterium]|nr:BON domain-containing protein [Bryobacterales bacterium]